MPSEGRVDLVYLNSNGETTPRISVAVGNVTVDVIRASFNVSKFIKKAV